MKKLLDYHIVRGVIHCETGFRIGGTKETMEIGGIDNAVIKHPITRLPYIPGSSLKGKLRSLLELKHGKYSDRGEPYGGKLPNGDYDTQCPISRVFGPHKNTTHPFGPTRIIVRDAQLTNEWAELLGQRFREMGDNYLEIKSENTINRKIGVAIHSGLRTMERVPAGTEFDFEIVLRNFDYFPDERSANLATLKEAMELLRADYLGGSGSRGYGQISFRSMTLNGEGFEL